MGLFFKKKPMVKKEAPRELPSLKPDSGVRAGLTPSPLRSDIEHIRPEMKRISMPPEAKIPPLPEKPLPAFPEPQMKPLPKFDFEEKPKNLPEFPEIKEMPPEERFYEEESVYEVGKEVEELKERAPVKPVFVDVEHFKDILDDLNSTKLDLKEGMEIMQKLEEIKLEKDKNFDKWKSQLEDIQRKLIFIDKTLFEIKYV
jgi:hypothetical protein